MGKKKYIDKKKSATFRLLARDSSDSNYADEPGSDRVFIRVDNNPVPVSNFFDDESHADLSANGDPNYIFDDAPEDEDGDGDDIVHGSSTKSSIVIVGDDRRDRSLPDHIRKEIIELGFPDDGYNYLTHLREIRNTGGGSAFYHNPKAKLDKLPNDMKAYDASRLRIPKLDEDPSEKSIYSVASNIKGVKIQKAYDPEVSELLDDSDLSRFDSNAEDLEDDFVVQANCPEGERDDEVDSGLNLLDESVPSTNFIRRPDEAGPSQVADYVESLNEVTDHLAGVLVAPRIKEPRVRRPLDEQFDLLEHQEYGSDDENYDAYVAEGDESLADNLKQSFNGFDMGDIKHEECYKTPAEIVRAKDGATIEAVVNRRCIEYGQGYDNETEDMDVIAVEDSSEESEVWDCETIVSTYSNLDNHPGKIEAPEITRRKKLAETISGALGDHGHAISLCGKEMLPVDYLPGGRKTATEKVKAVGSVRAKQHKRNQHGQESKEEKKERKAAVKEERREARRAKKEMKGLYRYEAQRAQRVAAISGPASVPII